MELVVGVMVGLAACFGVVGFFREQPSKRRVNLPEPRPLVGLVDGQVTSARGQVCDPQGMARSPITGQSCIAYRLRIKVVEERSWLVSRDVCVPFTIDDGTATARVETERAKLHFEGDQSWDIVTIADHQRLHELLVDELGADALDDLDDRPLLYREYRATASAMATVNGRVDLELDTAPSSTIGYRDRGTIPVFRSSPKQALTVVLDR